MAAPIKRKSFGKLSTTKKNQRIANNLQNHFENLARCVEDICPNLANFYRVKHLEDVDTEMRPTEGHCPHCNKPYTPGNFHTRLQPKPKLTTKIQKLLTRYASNPGSLGKFHQKLVEDYSEGQTLLVTTCLTCKKKVKQKGQTRINREKQKTSIRQNRDNRKDEVKVMTAEEQRQEKKRGRNRAKKQRRKAGDRDVNAGLTLPPDLCKETLSSALTKDTLSSALTKDTLSSGTCKDSLSPESSKVAGAFLEDDKSSTDTTPTLPVIRQTLTEETSSETSSVITSISGTSSTKTTTKHQKPKHSDVDLKKVLAMKSMKHMGNSSVPPTMNSHKKKKQLGQALGFILKKKTNKPSEGSLSDFLSSL